MITLAEVATAALRMHAVISFGPGSFDEVDAEEAAEQAMSPALSNRAWVITSEAFSAADGWTLSADFDGVRDLRRPAGTCRIGRSHINHDVFDCAAQAQLSDGRFLTFVERA